MEKINKLLQSEKAWIIAFIPGLNALYITFWLMTYQGTYKGEKWGMKKAFSIISLIIGIPAILLILFTDWIWLVAILVGYVYEAAIAYYLLRESYGRYVFSGKSLVIPIILSAVVFFLLFTGLVDSTAENEEECRTAAVAFAENDSETWEELIHPKFVNEIKDISKTKEQFSKDVADITEDFEIGKRIRYKGHLTKSYKEYNYTFLLENGDEAYELTLTYKEDEFGEGITEIKLTTSTYYFPKFTK